MKLRIRTLAGLGIAGLLALGLSSCGPNPALLEAVKASVIPQITSEHTVAEILDLFSDNSTEWRFNSLKPEDNPEGGWLGLMAAWSNEDQENVEVYFRMPAPGGPSELLGSEIGGTRFDRLATINLMLDHLEMMAPQWNLPVRVPAAGPESPPAAE